MTAQETTTAGKCSGCAHAAHDGRVCGAYVFDAERLAATLCLCGLEDEGCES